MTAVVVAGLGFGTCAEIDYFRLAPFASLAVALFILFMLIVPTVMMNALIGKPLLSIVSHQPRAT